MFRITGTFFSFISCMKNLLANKRLITHQTVATRTNNTQTSGTACSAIIKSTVSLNILISQCAMEQNLFSLHFLKFPPIRTGFKINLQIIIDFHFCFELMFYITGHIL